MAAGSDFDICNEALAYAGVTSFIGALDEDSTEANVCELFYARARDRVLEECPWPFATRRSVLPLLDGVERNGWDYVYTLPSDCIAPRSIVLDGVPFPPAECRIEFAVEANDAGDGSVLVTNQEDAELVYTARIESVGSFSDLFVEALAWRLAAMIAIPLLKKPEVRDGAMKQYMIARAEGFTAAARAMHVRAPVTSSIAARSGYRFPRRRS